MRTLDAAIQTAATSPVIRPLVMVRLDFDSGTIAWHSGFGTVTFDGVNYTGLGTLSSISQVVEQPGVQSSSITINISGIKPEIVALALTEPYINRKAYLHLTFLDEEDQPLVADPVLIFAGTIDQIEGQVGSEAVFRITIKSRLADWERTRKLRYTDSDQQKLYPGDKGMEFIPQLSERMLIWPRAKFLPDPRD